MSFAVSKFRGRLATALASLAVEYVQTYAAFAVAGALLDEWALAGIALVQPVAQIVLGVSCVVSEGTTILYGAAMGRFDREGAARAFSTGFWSAVGAGVTLALFTLISRDVLLSFTDVSGPTIGYAREYGFWFSLAVLVLPLYKFLHATVYADGNQRLCAVSYAVTIGITVIGAVLLCRLLGIAGCALSLFSAHLLAMGVLLLHFRSPSNSLELRRHFSVRELGRMLKASCGDACVPVCGAIVLATLNTFVGARFGADGVAIAAVVAATTGLTVLADGISVAAQPLIEVYAGEGNTRGVRVLMRAVIVSALAFGMILSVGLLAYPDAALRLVSFDDPMLVGRARLAVRIMASSFAFWSLVQVFNSYYLYIERPMLSLGITLLKDLAFPVLFLAIGGFLWGETGLWIGYALAAPMAVVAFFGWRVSRPSGPLALDPRRDAGIRMWSLALTPERICAVAEEIGEANGQRAALLVEETLMTVHDRNANRRVHAEVTIDSNPIPDDDAEAVGAVRLTLRDDGVLFDMTDADAQVTSLRAHVVSSLMERQRDRRNLTTTGLNRNAFVLR